MSLCLTETMTVKKTGGDDKGYIKLKKTSRKKLILLQTWVDKGSVGICVCRCLEKFNYISAESVSINDKDCQLSPELTRTQERNRMKYIRIQHKKWNSSS